MAVITRKPVVATKPAVKAVAAKKVTAATVVVNGFTILKGIEVPQRSHARSSELNTLFASMEQGDCVEISVGEDQKNISKMNSLYNAAKRNGADVTIRLHDAGKDSMGGVLRLWYNGQRAE